MSCISSEVISMQKRNEATEILVFEFELITGKSCDFPGNNRIKQPTPTYTCLDAV